MAERLSRRRFIKYGVGAAATVAAPELLETVWPLQAPAAGQRLNPLQPELRSPRALRSRNGRLQLKLVCTPATVDMNATKPVKTWTYDGVVPGYTWEMQGGDLLVVNLHNRLPKLPYQPKMTMDRPHEWTTTNLHTHGLHVSPSGIADNVFLQIPPGDRQHYEIPVPEDHPAGLFWYHPHKHGGVTQQVRGGMAGIIVMRGDLDHIPEIAAAKERIMVLQSTELGTDYQLLDPIPDPTKEQAFFPRKNVLYTVNGKLKPKVTMYPGEVQRWRLLNAAEGKYMSLKLQDHDMHQLAWDGLTLPAPEATDVVLLSSGNRVELLIKAGKPGVYELMLTPGSSQKPNIPGMPESIPQSESDLFCRLNGSAGMAVMPRSGLEDEPPELTPRSILTVVVRGSGAEMHLPADLPAWNPRMLPVSRTRRFAFTVKRDPMGEFLEFGIDGKQFEADNPAYRVALNSAEEWTLVNQCDIKLMDHSHVYHVHVNPFKIIEINGKKLSTPLWRDTYVLTKRSGDSLKFVSNFVDFTGKFVEHCHVLGHEDLGMMGSVEVVR